MPKHKGFGRGFKNVIVLGLTISVFMLIMFLGQDVLSQIVLINFIITLGGLESYQDTVIGVSIIFLLIGLLMIALGKK